MSMHDIRPGRLSAAQIADNYHALQPPLNAMQAEQEAARCLFCFDAPCTEACPTGIDIAGFIRKISTGNVRGAAVTILNENIMGGTCAKVCPVEELCEQACVKNTAESKPVEIGRLQDYATAHLFERAIQPFRRAASTGRHVAVVGAGPAGLACAHRLALLGHEVTVIEARPKPGGLNEYGLAAYKMLDERAAREVEFILALGGIEIRTGARLGKEVSLDALRQIYDAVFLGLGHNAVNALGVDGEQAAGVYNAVDFIERIRQEDLATLPVGRRVVVVGGGNTAIDIAVQVKKLGAEYVTLVYRRGEEDMGATDHEQAIAQTNGVLIKLWAQPVRILTDPGGVTGVEFEYTRYDAGQRLVGSGETFTIGADMVFKAIGQHFEPAPFGDSEAPRLEHGRIRVDQDRRTSLPGVWAGGDCVAGQDLTVVAVQDGKIAARSIHEFLLEKADG
jgi:glutamate synthase (NADPH/NADH) small chain